MKLLFKIGLFITLATLVFCCKKAIVDEVSLNRLYPIIKIGQIKEYKVNETIRTVGKETKDEYFIKEEVTDTLRFNQELYYVKMIYKGRTENGPWTYFETAFEYQNLKGVFEKKENIHVQKIGFPVSFSTTWKINQRIESLDNNIAKYLNFKAPYAIGTDQWIDGYVVQVENDSTGIHNFQEEEFYSPKFGLVASIKKTVFYCQDNADCLGKNIEESNKKITKTLERITL